MRIQLMARDLTEADAESIRQLMEQLKKRCNDTYDGVARVLGYDPGTVSRFMTHKSSGSLGLAKAVAEEFGLELGEALSYKRVQGPTWEQIDGYDEAEAVAREMAKAQGRKIEEWAWEDTRELKTTPYFTSITGDLVVSMAAQIMRVWTERTSANGSSTILKKSRPKRL